MSGVFNVWSVKSGNRSANASEKSEPLLSELQLILRSELPLRSWWKSAKQHSVVGERFLQGTWTRQQLLKSNLWNTIKRVCINTVSKDKQLCVCCVGSRTQTGARVLQITSVLPIHTLTCSQLTSAPCSFVYLYSCTVTIKKAQFYNCWLCNLCKIPPARQLSVNG